MLYTSRSPSAGNQPRVLTLHCESRHEAARWVAALTRMMRSHRMGGKLGRSTHMPPRWFAGKAEMVGPPFPAREALVDGRWRTLQQRRRLEDCYAWPEFSRLFLKLTLSERGL